MENVDAMGKSVMAARFYLPLRLSIHKRVNSNSSTRKGSWSDEKSEFEI